MHKARFNYFSFIIFLMWIFLLQAMPALSEEGLQKEHSQHDRSELILESILRSAPAGIGVVEHRKFVQVNDYILDLTGYTREELIGQSTRMLYPAHKDYDYVEKEKYRQISEQGKGTVESRWVHKDGSIRHVLLSSHALDAKDLSVGVAFVVIDISDRKQSEERFEKAFSSSPAPLVVSEISTGRFIEVNDRWVEMLGHSREEQIGRTSKELGIWSDPSERDRIVAKIEDRGFFKDEPIHFKTKSGDDKFAFWSAEVVTLEGREVLLSLIMDITDRKLAEEALETRTRSFILALTGLIALLLTLIVCLTISLRQRKRSEQKLRQSEMRAQKQRAAVANLVLDKEVLGGEQHAALERITETVSDVMNVSRAGIWILTSDHSELRCLSVYEATSGRHSSGSVLETSDFPRYFKALSAESRISVNDVQNDPRTSELSQGYLVPAGISSMLDAAVLVEGHLAGVVSLEQVGGVRHWHSDEEAFASTIAALVAQVMANVRRRQAEEDREKLQSQLFQAQKMESVGILAGGVAHDFNNLLQTMRSNIELLSKHQSLYDQSKKRIDSIVRSLDRAAKLVQQLLLFGRKAESSKVKIDINSEVSEVTRILERTIPKMIDLELHLDPEVPSVSGDPVQIEQVLLNLANNAVDAMPQGGRLVMETSKVVLDEKFARMHPGSTFGPYVLLTVSDTGSGMDKETLKHIYDPFFTTKEMGKGTGLGLASAYGIIKAHGGYIQCYSEPEKGTTFRVYLPVLDQINYSLKEEYAENKIKGGRETIMVVDDESEIRELTREALGDFGYKIITASDGEKALEIYKERGAEIDLVLLDLNMPGMGGHKCLQELIQLNPSVKVIIASGYSANGQAKESLSSGAREFIGKPYQLIVLAGTVRRVLDEVEQTN